LKWNGQLFHLELDPLDDVAILRYEIFKETQVKQERQKILNLKAKGAGKKCFDYVVDACRMFVLTCGCYDGTI
jgi:hypothetical protein